jgi:hypothetical protein
MVVAYLLSKELIAFFYKLFYSNSQFDNQRFFLRSALEQSFCEFSDSIFNFFSGHKCYTKKGRLAPSFFLNNVFYTIQSEPLVWIGGLVENACHRRCGFIGMHCALRLLDRGDEVVGIDNLNDYYDVSLKQARLAKLSSKENFNFHKVDISDRNAMVCLCLRPKQPDSCHSPRRSRPACVTH